MFEHMKNYGELLRMLASALKPQGKLFVHIMCHKYVPYHFEEDDLNAWMTKNFFKGGTMPSQFLLRAFSEDLVVEQQWNVNGRNYTLTLEGWLQRMDARHDDMLRIFAGAPGGPALQLRRWRIFMIACAEFFRFRGGSEFFVTQLLFGKGQQQRSLE
jgi:cyclopropane-fatty-acyl-phospholipid synthase